MDTSTDRLVEAVSAMLRRLGVEVVVDEEGQTIARAAAAPAELPPLSGYGDTISQGDTVRVYYQDGLRRQKPVEDLALDRVVVDYDAEEGWMVVTPAAGLEPGQGATSFHLQGPGPRPTWRRRLELVTPA